MNNLKSVYKFGYFWLILAFSGSGYVQVATNLEILEEVFIQPVISCLDSVAGPAASVRIENSSLTDFHVWVQDYLRRSMIEQGYAVFDNATDSNEQTYAVVLENLVSEIYYRPIGRSLLMRENRFERSFNTLLSFYIKNKDESIEHSHSKNIVVQDTISANDLSQIENDLFQFSRGVKSESGWVRKVFEPVVITATTIVIVYLFFSLRSG
jgi:hypothetical protein